MSLVGPSCALLAALLGGCAPAPAPASGPSLVVVGPANWDSGPVEAGATVEHTFTLKNVSDEPLVIDALRQSCTCTSLEASTMAVGPGEALDVLMTVETDDGFGKRATAWVEWEGASGKAYCKLSISATVANRVRMRADPPSLSFNTRTPTEVKRATVSYFHYETPLDELVVASKPAWCSVEVRPSGAIQPPVEGQPVEQTFELVVTPLTSPSGEERDLPVEMVELEARGVEDVPSLKVKVSWHTESEFTVEPAAVFLGTVAAGVPSLERKVKLRRSSWSTTELEGVGGGDILDVQWEEVDEGEFEIAVSCRVPETQEAGPVSSELIIEFKGASRDLRVPVRGIVGP